MVDVLTDKRFGSFEEDPSAVVADVVDYIWRRQ
jgi:hypothetical protein